MKNHIIVVKRKKQTVGGRARKAMFFHILLDLELAN